MFFCLNVVDFVVIVVVGVSIYLEFSFKSFDFHYNHFLELFNYVEFY